MSYSVDANLLLYAANRGSPEHAQAVAFLETRAADTEIFCLPWQTIGAFLRIATHPSIFSTPLAVSQAEDVVERLFALPQLRLISELDDFWKTYRSSSWPANRGNAVPDTLLAALLRQHGVKTLYTRDQGFRRFTFLDIRDPFTSRS